MARSDLAVARVARVPEAVPATGCFLAQQAAEKSLKGVLLQLGVPFQRTHDVGILVDSLPSDLNAPDDVARSVLLTRFAVDTRYPGSHELPSWEDYGRALRLAEAVVTWATETIQSAQ